MFGSNYHQEIVFAVIAMAFVLFIWGRWRFDLVALFTLLILVLTDIVPPREAFTGFAHPAVITVASVLIIGRSLANVGVADSINRLLLTLGPGKLIQLAALTGLTVLLSAFMNNVGALVLMMPVAIETARRTGRSPSFLLMPLAFGSLLGGLITAIGTPPNMVIATIRNDMGNAPPFGMFEFSPVGLGVAAAGFIFIVLIGWRLIPSRTSPSGALDAFSIQEYVTEIVVPADATMAGSILGEIKNSMDADFDIVGLIRNETKYDAPSTLQTILAGDILIIEGDPKDLQELLSVTGFQIAGGDGSVTWSSNKGDLITSEAVIAPNSELEGRTPSGIDMLKRYGINLLAVSRQGEHIQERLSSLRLAIGDVLLVQGNPGSVREGLRSMGVLPLVGRDIRLNRPKQHAPLVISIFIVAIILAATNVISIQIAFVSAAFLMILAGSVSLREAYDSVNWPVIVLLAAMIPIEGALVSTGGSLTIADAINSIGAHGSLALTLLIILVATMILSGVVNNTAAAVIMAPIAIDVAVGMGVGIDPLLMAVAVGASAAFLTPIGHQSSTLVMGPGGYKFTDYWRVGLPLSLVVIAVSIPLIIFVWTP
ncbi:MAG: SLC13 family permease [Dehalococcoidia bacterium]|nr:SLC13 family permease [Dehalococcoidia bacterium]